MIAARELEVDWALTAIRFRLDHNVSLNTDCVSVSEEELSDLWFGDDACLREADAKVDPVMASGRSVGAAAVEPATSRL